MTDLSALIEKLESATGPDAELERLIYWHVIKPRYASFRPGELGEFVPIEEAMVFAFAPAVTRSVDAAVELVPPGYAWACDHCRLDTHAFVCVDDGVTDSDGHQGWGPTMPIAMCIAALKARQEVLDFAADPTLRKRLPANVIEQDALRARQAMETE